MGHSGRCARRRMRQSALQRKSRMYGSRPPSYPNSCATRLRVARAPSFRRWETRLTDLPSVGISRRKPPAGGSRSQPGSRLRYSRIGVDFPLERAAKPPDKESELPGMTRRGFVVTAASAARVLGANDRVRLASIGCGGRGQHLMRMAKQAGGAEFVGGLRRLGCAPARRSR